MCCGKKKFACSIVWPYSMLKHDDAVQPMDFAHFFIFFLLLLLVVWPLLQRLSDSQALPTKYGLQFLKERKRQSRAEMYNQVVGYTFFIFPYLSYIQINRSIESLRHVIRLWTPFLVCLCSLSTFIFCFSLWHRCPFLMLLSCAFFPQTANAHAFYASIDYRGKKISHNNGFSISMNNIFIIIEKEWNDSWYNRTTSNIDIKKMDPTIIFCFVVSFLKDCPKPLFFAGII